MSSPGSQKEKSLKNTKAAPRISNPRRLLILTPAPHSHNVVPPFLHSLTGVPVTNAPQATNDAQSDGKAEPFTPSSAEDDVVVSSTFAGYTTHSPLRIETKYYTADIPIWVDELPFLYNNSASAPSLTQVQPNETGCIDAGSQLPLHNNLAAWGSEFLSDEAREVRDVIGAIVVCIERPTIAPSVSFPSDDDPDMSGDREHRMGIAQGIKELVSTVAEVRNRIEEERGGLGEVPGLVILVGKDEGEKKAENVKGKRNGLGGLEDSGDDEVEQILEFSTRWWEDELSEMGHFELEVVAWDPQDEGNGDERNNFGELQGMPRIREVLRTNEWTSCSQGDLSTDFLLDSDGETGFDKEASELEREMFDLRLAIEKGGDELGTGEPGPKNEDEEDELQVERMDGLMLRMQAIKDMAAELPEAERKAFAVKAINDIMKDI
ncbi:hypothetical protein RJZ56_005978 [Blastomyces dermatitidis]|uniref:Alpha and gamma adaptin binding protein p34 n=2 Tax=Ajellomyces dermatitidis TaxID=5039 RepID=F2T6A2_AJEDA|nr:uncharacterized protein BDCG_05809 [Blastomyces dermatitidis ER-3]EEQ90689.2 hypothetical protein BDCG_05809 [Blastomyces dermatitidis ER-3]EGE78982.1 hypothetical protein BDDG_01919 [Blastomyces dermatitidis ATCC 18188]EQL29669.1 hypothetical protein BDFG_07722 [Blastomyces dermatitidis ATCC 26199]